MPPSPSMGLCIPRLLAYSQSWSALSAIIQTLHPRRPPPSPTKTLAHSSVQCTSHQDHPLPCYRIPSCVQALSPLARMQACTFCGCRPGKPGTPAPPPMATAPDFAPHPQDHGSPWGIMAPSCPTCPGLAVLHEGAGQPAARGSAPFPGGHAASTQGWGCSAAQRPPEDAAQGWAAARRVAWASLSPEQVSNTSPRPWGTCWEELGNKCFLLPWSRYPNKSSPLDPAPCDGG